MTETDRIPLDSDFWLRPELGNVHELLTDLLAKDDLNSLDVSKFISSLDRTGDEMEPEYFATIPYLLDLFEAEPEKFRGSLINFCGSLCKPCAPPPDEYWTPVIAQRNRIGRVFFNALCARRSELDWIGPSMGGSEFVVACIAGIAAVFTDPDEALKIYRGYMEID